MGMTSLPGAAAVAAMGQAAKGLAEVFTPSATRDMELKAEVQTAALSQMEAEFGLPALGRFDRFVNGLNRLPRPLLAFGTIGLFVHAMADPAGFAQRMVGLNAVPEPLWWLLGAVVAFYFGARETFHYRVRAAAPRPQPGKPVPAGDNPALRDWQAGDR